VDQALWAVVRRRASSKGQYDLCAILWPIPAKSRSGIDFQLEVS